MVAQLGGFSVYVLFIAQNLAAVINSLVEDLDWDYRIYLALAFLPMLALCSVRNLHYLSPFTLLANVFEFYTLGVVFYYLLSPPLNRFDSLPLFSSWKQLPLFFGTGTATHTVHYL